MTSKENVTQQKAFAKANNHMAVHLHRILAEKGGNVFFSPFSVSTAMAMLLSASEGETWSQIRAALGHLHAELPETGWESVIEQYLSLLLKEQKAYSLSTANCLMVRKGFDVKDGYRAVLAESFKAEVMEVDFRGDVSEAIEIINRWISDRTKGMIPKFLKSLSPVTLMALVNAVYFKGSWLRKFNAEKTSLKNFYNKGKKEGAKRVDMMHMKGEQFPYAENKSLQALQLPYVGQDLAMMLLLPRAKDGLAALESSLPFTFLEDLEKTMVTLKVNVMMPKFRMEYDISLKLAFERLGVRKAFQFGAELGKATDCTGLAVSDVLHKAVLVVNEEGSEASAATVIPIMRSRASLSPEFVADHPFILVIYDRRNKMILFLGRVEEL